MKQFELAIAYMEMRQLMTHAYQKQFTEVLRTYDLSQMDITILLFLANNPEYDTASDLVKHRHLTKSYVSKSIEQLVQRGYLKRSYQGDNHKAVHLTILADALPIIAAGRKCQERFTRIIHQGINEADAEIAERVLRTVMSNAANACKERI